MNSTTFLETKESKHAVDMSPDNHYLKSTISNGTTDESGEGSEGCYHPEVSYCVGQTDLKGEDVVFLEHKRAWPGRGDESFCGTKSIEDGNGVFHHHSCTCCGHVTSQYSLFCVFDGHNGKHAARHSADKVLTVLEKHLPRGNPPPPNHADYDEWRQLIQRALVITLVELNSTFAARGIHAGCTSTIVIVTDWLVTSVNLGDSHAYLDTGSQLIRLTSDHRVAVNKADRKRVELSGAVVAPVSMSGCGPADAYNSGLGPLRVWPGGLSISRAIGDFDVGPSIIPYGYVTQVMVCGRGGRLLIGSDGVWDAFQKKKKAAMMTRKWSIDAAPSKVISNIIKQHGNVKDDTSLIVVDVVPSDVSFQDMAAVAAKPGLAMKLGGSNKGMSRNESSGNLFCACFGSSGSGTLAKEAKMDDSVRSASSAISYLNAGQNDTISSILDELDMAEALGLIPNLSPRFSMPEWLTEELRDALTAAALHATETWLEASGKKPPSIMPQRKSKVSFAEDVVQVQKTETVVTAVETAIMQRNSSLHFKDSVVEDDKDYGSKFGHYNRSGSLGPASGGPGHPVIPGDMSVRAGRIYNSEASVRAGTQFRPNLEEPSVRILGSNLNGSVHRKAYDIIEEPEDEEDAAPKLRTVHKVKRESS